MKQTDARYVKFGKTNAEYMKLKSVFYDMEQNRHWSDLARQVCAKYVQQPLRKGCVACETPLGPTLFSIHDVPYTLCPTCGHLNGTHEDTDAFAEFLYAATGASHAAAVYGDASRESFNSRMRAVYVPKAEFLIEALRREGADPAKLTYADLGAGAGHFVAALRECGLSRSVGYDASPELVASTNQMFNAELMRHNEVGALQKLAEEVDASVVTMIFSLEHVTGLRSFLGALSRNKAVKHFFFAVPVFNPSVFLEALFPNVMPRILGLGHTHLFTDKSIDILCRDFGMRRTAEWWFGGNAFDVHRIAAIALQSSQPAAGAQAWNEMLLPMIDDLQLAFDHHKLSSEVHVLASLRR